MLLISHLFYLKPLHSPVLSSSLRVPRFCLFHFVVFPPFCPPLSLCSFHSCLISVPISLSLTPLNPFALALDSIPLSLCSTSSIHSHLAQKPAFLESDPLPRSSSARVHRIRFNFALAKFCHFALSHLPFTSSLSLATWRHLLLLPRYDLCHWRSLLQPLILLQDLLSSTPH